LPCIRAILPSSHGNVYELYAIAAAVLGGVSLRGGEGSVIGVVLGAILLQVLQNLVNLLGIPSSLNFAVSGSVISIRVLADQEHADFRERRERLRRLADGGAAAPVEPAIDADDRIASPASTK
jgi:ribose transport system permease protein